MSCSKIKLPRFAELEEALDSVADYSHVWLGDFGAFWQKSGNENDAYNQRIRRNHG